MSDHSHEVHLPADGEHFDVSTIAKVRSLLLIIGGACLIGSLVVFCIPKLREVFSYSWLFAFYFFLSLAFGGLFWTLLHNATNSGWGIGVRRVFENLACVIPAMFVFAIPLLCPQMMDALYEWSRAHTQISAEAAKQAPTASAAADHGHGLRHLIHEKAKVDPHYHLLYHKYPYLNRTFYWIRVIGYFVMLGLIALQMRRWSTRQDEDGNAKWTLRARRWACGFLPLFAVGVTFSAIDFLGGLEYEWFSTMWGVYIFAGCALNSMAVSILTVHLLKRLGYLKLVNQEHLHIMGKLMFAFVVFWAYVGFSQYFLIWYANIPEETRYFLLRNTEGWNFGSTALVIGHFVVPFLFLLRAKVKKSPKLVCVGCAWVLAAHALDYYIIIIPERFVSLASWQEMLKAASPVYYSAILLDLLAFVAIGALSAWYFLGSLAKQRLYPFRDPRLHESVNLVN